MRSPLYGCLDRESGLAEAKALPNGRLRHRETGGSRGLVDQENGNEGITLFVFLSSRFEGVCPSTYG
jgi:hypothetical protein